jgi:hypothetical protein
MLSNEEIQEFLALLLSFCSRTKTSARGLAKLFDLTPNTAARWLRAARGKGGVDRLYYVRTDCIKQAIMHANLYDSKYATYRRIASLEDVGKRIAELKSLLAKAQ